MKLPRFLATAATALLATIALPASAEDVVIHAGRSIDGVSKTPRTNVSIMTRDQVNGCFILQAFQSA